jgi:polar amino acid transport system substrate-binding protein
MLTLLMRFMVAGFLIVFSGSLVSYAQEPASPPRDVKIVTRVLPPMVIDRDNSLSGFSIDLMNEVSARLNLRPNYVTAPDVRALLEEVRSKRAEVGISAVSITSARELEFDFSQPMLNAGLQIMTRAQSGGGGTPLSDLLRLLISSTSLAWLGIAVLIILIPAHIVWALERRHPQGIIGNTKYFPGIFVALYWAASTLVTQADASPRQAFARVVALLWMFTGVVFVALYTAQLTATLTVQQIAGSISGPEDLVGKKVAVTAGSTASAIVRELRAQPFEVRQINEAFEALIDKKVDAIVFDAPVLLYFAANEGKGQVQLVGSPFRKEDYGIVFQQGSAMRSEVNVALLRMREDGTYQRIYDRWFASK